MIITGSMIAQKELPIDFPIVDLISFKANRASALISTNPKVQGPLKNSNVSESLMHSCTPMRNNICIRIATLQYNIYNKIQNLFLFSFFFLGMELGDLNLDV